MGESFYGMENYGVGDYSESPYINFSSSITTSFALDADNERVRDVDQLLGTTFALDADNERVRDVDQLLGTVFAGGAVAEIVNDVAQLVGVVFTVHAVASYLTNGGAQLTVECTISPDYEAGKFWQDQTAPDDWQDTPAPVDPWTNTTSEQWNG